MLGLQQAGNAGIPAVIGDSGNAGTQTTKTPMFWYVESGQTGVSVVIVEFGNAGAQTSWKNCSICNNWRFWKSWNPNP